MVSRETPLEIAERCLIRHAETWSLTLDGEAMSLLRHYASVLSTYEEANVIGVREPGRVLTEHIMDSLGCMVYEPLSKVENLIDIGSGGGLPGIPIALVVPHLQTTLLEATGKKALFLSSMITEMKIADCNVLNERAEHVGRGLDHRERYACATVRAVDSLPVVAEYAMPLIQPGGFLIAMKGVVTSGEVERGAKAARILGAELSEVIPVPFLDCAPQDHRTLVILTKNTSTPGTYPRRPGVPRKKPLT